MIESEEKVEQDKLVSDSMSNCYVPDLTLVIDYMAKRWSRLLKVIRKSYRKRITRGIKKKVTSMDGLFLENGPYRVQKDLTLTVNPGGWQNYATNVYG